MLKRGLVIGKFYPFHKGHQNLVQTAMRNCQKLYIIICSAQNQQPNAYLRKQWIKQLYPQAISTVLIDRNYNPDDSKLWAQLTIKHLGFAPDIVFTSQQYGKLYSKYLNCQNYLVDLQRKQVPISGTKVRSNPLKYWDYISHPIRGYYAKRVTIVGPESTGKTTLIKKLANLFNTIWVPEYGREYSYQKLVDKQKIIFQWNTDDFVNIAKQQNRQQNEMARRCNKLLLCDTNSLATHVWHLRYMNFQSDLVLNQALKIKKPDLTLVTRPDQNTPFVQDGIRDGQKIRLKMFGDFQRILKKYNHPYHVLEGNYQTRQKQAIELIKSISPQIKEKKL